MDLRLASLALLGSGATAVIGCDLFHDTDWASQCASSDASCSGGSAASSTSGGGGVGSAHSASSNGASGATSSTSATGGAGSGGATATGCEGIAGGVEHDGHCYVSGSDPSTGWDASRSECEAIGAAAGRQGHLPVLDSAAELAFLVRSLLQATATESDTWIGFECDAALHPTLAECGCDPCVDLAELEAKRANWAWIDDLPGGFKGWVADDPNANGRCGAVTFYDLTAWGMVDRPCDSVSWDVDGVMRSYRTVCEIE